MTALYTSDGMSKDSIHLFTDLNQVKDWLNGVYRDYHTRLDRIPQAEWERVREDLAGRLHESAHEISGSHCMCYFLVADFTLDSLPKDGKLWAGAAFEEGRTLGWSVRMISGRKSDILTAIRRTFSSTATVKNGTTTVTAVEMDEGADRSQEAAAIRTTIEKPLKRTRPCNS